MDFLLLNLNYFYVVIQYMCIGGFAVNHVYGLPIQDKEVHIKQLFMEF